MFRKALRYGAYALLTGAALFALATTASVHPPQKEFERIRSDAASLIVTDRSGVPLSISYQNQWNGADTRALYALPPLLVDAFVFSEDRRFYDHGGVNWNARASALWQNIRHRKTVRGASTITEQVVRMINPRPRTLWSKWLEGIESAMLERHTNKNTILEFYLNQVPYASHRRGAAQAARFYFNRDLDTLTAKETLALVILARAPSAYDLYRNPGAVDAPLERLARALKESGKISGDDFARYARETLETQSPALPVDARHFARYARLHAQDGTLRTTLDSTLQSQVQDLLDRRVAKLKSKNVRNAGAIVIDHANGDILAWVVAGANDPQTPAGDIDVVLSPRQPGSTLKPFVYAQALEKGWTAATILNDAPVAEAVGSGLHRFRNYSGAHYGPITLREALGNSLNIPAVLAVNHVGVDPFLSILHRLGFDSLDRGASVYDEGLALGNGEVTLLELARAYSALANRGETLPLRVLMEGRTARETDQIFTPETSSIIGHILSDPRARMLEFGSDSVLNLPVRTAIKTGTSTDYRDAWTVGYNDRYTVALWMGNLDRKPMKDVTGSTGPALVLRSVFDLLNRARDTKPLYLSPALLRADICTRPGGDPQTCPRRTELFAASTQDSAPPPSAKPRRTELIRPTQGLMMAYDPRIPAQHQQFRFELSALQDGAEAEWILNGESIGRAASPRFLWPLEKGPQTLEVRIYDGEKLAEALSPVRFTVR